MFITYYFLSNLKQFTDFLLHITNRKHSNFLLQQTIKHLIKTHLLIKSLKIFTQNSGTSNDDVTSRHESPDFKRLPSSLWQWWRRREIRRYHFYWHCNITLGGAFSLRLGNNKPAPRAMWERGKKGELRCWLIWDRK